MENKDIIEKKSQDTTFYKKTEKLTLAVFMVTDPLNDKEPLKWELRSAALSFMGFVRDVASGAAAGSPSTMKLRSRLAGILSSLDIAGEARIISSMNTSILHEEYTSVAACVNQCIKNAPLEREETPLSTLLETGGKEDSFDSIENLLARKGHNGRSKRQKINSNPDSNKTYQGGSSQLKSIDEKTKNKEGEHITKRQEKNKRQNDILYVLQSRGELSIKDISSVVSYCSEKTIQRELLSLIDQGKVGRRGARRWSKYYIV